jgi:hypothetical protein
VKTINSKSPILSRFGHFVESINRELGLMRSVMIVYVKWEVNSAAYGLV